MFYLKVRDEKSNLNGIQVHKLKEKLGTKQLPTAELILQGTEATLIGDPGRGVALISGMLTVTRIHNAIAACSNLRRMTQLARDYATKRTAFKVRNRDIQLLLKINNYFRTETFSSFFRFKIIKILIDNLG